MKREVIDVWIITMAFPDPSETFACNDVLALAENGVKIKVYGLRPKHKQFENLVSQQKFSGIEISHNSIKNSLQGLWFGLTQPLLFIDLIFWILNHTWKKPIYLVKSLVLVPRSFQIYRFSQQKSPDVVHLYWSHFPSLVGYLVKSKLPHIVVSISFVAHDIYSPGYGLSSSYAGSVARQADLIQTIAKANIPAIEKLNVDTERVLLSYHGLDFRKIKGGRPKVKHRIVTAGRMILDKGFDDVLKVFSIVLELWPDATLLLLGDGPERSKLEALSRDLNISHAVYFRGFVSHEIIFEEFAVAEVFLFMSKYIAERLPNVVKEAMACSCLCVTSYTPGIEELISNEVHGYIVSQGDVSEAAKWVDFGFSYPSRMEQITKAAYQHLKENFDLNTIIDHLHTEWQKLVDSKRF